MTVMNVPGNRISAWIRASLIFAVSTALAIHVFLAFCDIILPAILSYFLPNSSPTHTAMIIPRKKPAVSRQMILINPNLKDEKVEEATLLADASRQAKQPLPRLNLQKRDATIDKGAERVLVRPGARPSPAAPTQRPQPRPRRPQEQTPPEPSRKPVEPSTKGTLASKPPRPKQTTRNTPKPPIKVIKPSQPSVSGLTARNRMTTSLLTGDPSMAMLKKRWPEYFRKLVIKVESSLYRQTIVSHSSFKTGVVSFLCAINKDGSITIRKSVNRVQGMRSETEMFRRALMDAAPFGPLSKEMQADPIFNNLGFSLYIR